MGWYLCYFMHRHLDFRVAEFTALAELAGCGDTLQWRKPHGDAEHSPLWHVWLPSDAHAEEIMRRSILTKALIELWGEGEDVAALKSAIDAYPDERKAPFLAADRTFKVEIEDFGKSAHGTREDNWSPIVHRIDALKPSVEFLGRARMKNPDNLFWSVEVAPDLDGKGLPGDIPSRVYFGRVVARCDRSCIAKYDLTRRRYLGPTSMDVEMALIMCNMIHARPGGVVWDPFCGTGSILVAAAHYGAMTLGTDIDIRVIRWGKKDKRTGEPVDVWTNFEDYGLPPPVGLVRMDLHKNSWAGMERVEGTLQGVVGDPPYGVRAGGRKSGGRKRLPDGTVAAVPEAHKADHIPSTVPYPFSECMDDLLDGAARMLRVGGRLAFFLPAAASAEDAASAGADEVPSHPAMELRASSMQLLSTRWGRRLVTFEKTRAYDVEAAAEARRALAEAREAGGGMEDLLQRMRETVYHGERQKKKRAGGAGGERNADAADGQGAGEAVGAAHRAHSASGEKMAPAKRGGGRAKLV